MRRIALRWPALRRLTSLPDYNTRVDVDKIKLSKPKRPGSWVGLEGLSDRNKDSLIPDTLAKMEEDEREGVVTATSLMAAGRQKLSLEERKARRRLLSDLGVPGFRDFITQQNLAIQRKPAEILQLNIGLYCNQACNHCHVESSPKRKEMMDEKTAERCIELLKTSSTVKTLDITGGAPEMNSQFRRLVEAATAEGVEVIDRCNLTVLLEPDQADLVDFLADHRVRVVASLPCYSAKNVNMQRGNKVFERSIEGLLRLNDRGYGKEGSGLFLDLVYNPIGAFLPPPQEALEAKYKEELMDAFGIEFNGLFTITNMPIKRFADFLYRRGELKDYMELLVRNFNPSTVDSVMCTSTVSVGWDGKIYDCDFNQQLAMELSVPTATTEPTPVCDVFAIDSLDDMSQIPVRLDSHCFGCTAGMGSSCQGEVA
uniref:DUF3641 domain-containing protein n=1 Tax=Rhizochromulina marina TaxID=1034831 RepID=A0A7S2WVW2_9STRA|mmetsp:Transcript_9019/g.25769  ORF Transcript_9019/g.25769 Transcript_9019/m.25769 type:complete len:427 (+) Transcript_9019:53-1333(+)